MTELSPDIDWPRSY